jgi:hypothetical protein
MKNTRFDLEQAILDCWGITDDLDVLFEAIMDKDLDADKTANIILGLKDLYHLKFEKTFNLFEEMIREDHNSVSGRMR